MLGELPPAFNKEQDTAIDTGKEDNSLSNKGEEFLFSNVIKWCNTIGYIALISTK